MISNVRPLSCIVFPDALVGAEARAPGAFRNHDDASRVRPILIWREEAAPERLQPEH